MPRVHFGNFDVEHEWADGGYVRKPAVARLNAELATAFLGIARDGDVVWAPEPVDRGFERSLADAGLPSVTFASRWDEAASSMVELVPWGWSHEALRIAVEHFATADVPPHDAVRMSNRRSFSKGLEDEFHVAPAGLRTISEPRELDAAFAALPADDTPWVLKAEFGMSGRERLLGRGQPTDHGAHAWTRRRVERDGCVVFEPWLDVVDEVGIQFTIPRDGVPVLDGLVQNLVGDNGQYGGSRFGPAGLLESDWRPAIEVGRQAAEVIRDLGYYGPLGIDACRYADGEALRLRPLQDVNARCTMGRLALGFRDRFGESGGWLHVRWPVDAGTWVERLQSSLPSGVRLIATSPFQVGGRPVGHGTLLVLGHDVEAVDWMMNLVRGGPARTTRFDPSG